ncbi:kinase-regulated stress-responsive transcription factor skn7 [Aphanomyces cochlioides]|nr:kinase-regulated stress-responsive transcription factor skn7 [Aphanomyces cochlioides]
MHTSNVDAALSEFLLEGTFDAASSSGWWSEDSIDDTMSRKSSMDISTNDLDALNNAERTTKYLDKLYCMLEQCPTTIAAWTRNGTSFVVYNSDAFEKTIIPQYFKPVKFESFARQLNSYGFRKAKHHVNRSIVYEFRHSNFVRGQSHQLESIHRRRRVRRHPSPKAPAPPATDANVHAALVDLMGIVRTLKAELAETKAMVQSYLVAQDQIVQVTSI